MRALDFGHLSLFSGFLVNSGKGVRFYIDFGFIGERWLYFFGLLVPEVRFIFLGVCFITGVDDTKLFRPVLTLVLEGSELGSLLYRIQK